MLIVVADAALMSSTVRYRSFKEMPMARSRPSLLIVLIGLLIGLIVTNSEVVLMLIATIFVASGLTLHVVCSEETRHSNLG